MAIERNDETQTVVDGGVAADAALELTDREIALAQGLDPDSVDAVIVDVAEEDASGVGDGGSDVSDAGEAEAKDGKESGTDAAASSWVTADVKALAETYGLGDADLADLDSEDDFLRLARVLERRKPLPDSAAVEDKAADAKPDTVSGADEIPTIDPQKYVDAGYDAETVALARVAAAMQQQLGKIVPAFEQQQKAFADEQQRRTMAEFNAVADTLGRYGSSEKLAAGDAEKRKRLYETADLVAKDLQASGKPLPPLKTLVQRAEIVAFGDEIMAERRADLAKKVKGQSSRRRSVGRATATASPGKRVLPGEADDPVAAIMAAPEIKKFLAEHGV